MKTKYNSVQNSTYRLECNYDNDYYGDQKCICTKITNKQSAPPVDTKYQLFDTLWG